MWSLPGLTQIGFVSKSNACCCFPPAAELEVVGNTVLAHTRCPQILANDQLALKHELKLTQEVVPQCQALF